MIVLKILTTFSSLLFQSVHTFIHLLEAAAGPIIAIVVIILVVIAVIAVAVIARSQGLLCFAGKYRIHHASYLQKSNIKKMLLG